LSLREYNRKRRFAETPEPPGKPARRRGELRFVVQLHRATRLHYDVRLEMGGSFKSWAVPRGPSLNPMDQRLAVFVEDHPIAYGSFEGIIPRGNYGAGTVMIWDQGTYRERGHLESGDSDEGETAMLAGLERGHMTFVLEGEKLRGEFALIRLKKGPKEEKAWLLVKKRDEFSSYKIDRSEARSVATGRTMEEIAAQAVAKGEIWVSGRKATKTITKTKAIAKTKRITKTSTKGLGGAMPRRLKPMLARRGNEDLGGHLFCALTGGVRALAEVEGRRVSIHSRSLLRFNAKYPRIVEALEGAGLRALLDGEISRDGGSFRIFDLLHLDGEDLRELPLKARLAKLESLKLGEVLQKAPHHAKLDDALEEGDSVLARESGSAYRSGIHADWIELEAPRKTSSRDQAAAFTHLDKPYWKRERITKGDLIEYYRQVASVLLPHLQGHPMSLHRFPNGIESPGFYQKDFTGYKPRWLETHRIFSESTGKSIDYVLCQNENTLLYLANLGCIEMNPWLSCVGKLERPDSLVIDLDPDRQRFEQVVEVAHEVRKALEKAGAESFCKTSGATGMHVCVPLAAAKFDYEKTRELAEAICRKVAAKLPQLTTLERNPDKRGGRMYLDYMQNRIGQTLASAYSVRPRPGAPVSTPLRWSEVTRKLDPNDFTLETMPRRLEKLGDLWSPMLERQTDVAACLRKL
jgi:bifunctional non-homologous end joining protein LigD